MDAILIEQARQGNLAKASRRLDEVIFRRSGNNCFAGKALNNIWMFLHYCQVVPDDHECRTASVSFKKNKLIVNRWFLLEYIHSFEDLAFIVLRERHHVALRSLQEADVAKILWYQKDTDTTLQNFLEDTYIYGAVRRTVNTDLPERFYGHGTDREPGMERWLLHPACFDNYGSGFDQYSALGEIKTYELLCNIYGYHSRSIEINQANVSYEHWVRMAYPFFIKFLNKRAGESQEGENYQPGGEEEDGGEVVNGKEELEGRQSFRPDGEKKTEDDGDDDTTQSGNFHYQPIAESEPDESDMADLAEDDQAKEVARHFNRAGNGANYVSSKSIVAKSLEWDACLISQTSDDDPFELGDKVRLDSHIVDVFHAAANGLVTNALHTEKQMPFAYMPHHVGRRDVFSLGMGCQPVFWQHRVQDVNRNHYHIYFDVSESMAEYIGYLPSLFKALRNVDYTVYNFSRSVVEMPKHLCAKYYVGCGGTSYKALAEHILEKNVTHAFIITDGCGKVPQTIMPELESRLLDLILLKMTNSPEVSEWDSLASRVICPNE